MAKVLLVDTSFASTPIYEYLNRAGHDVHVVGGNPRDYLAKISKYYHEVDYSKIEDFGIFVNREKFEYIVPGCNDVSYHSCAAINLKGKYFGLDSIDTVAILNDKQKYRRFALNARLPVPKTYDLKEALDLSTPVIVKPVDAFSGKGIGIVRNPSLANELEATIALAQRASRSGRYVIEQFVEGQLFSHTAFVAQHQIVTDFVVEEHCTANPYAVDTSRVHAMFPIDLREKVRDAAEKTARLLKLKSGLLHTQFLVSGDEVWLIEPTRRCPGDLYSRLIELSTGINYAENYARPFLNLPHHFSSDSSVKSLILRHTVTDPVGGRLTSINFHADLRIKEFINLMSAGDVVKPAPAGRVAIFFGSADSLEEFNTLYRLALERSLYSCVA